MKENDGLLPDDIKRAREILSDWCSNDGKKFRMCVPVQPDDSDEIMSRVIDAAEAALTASRPVVVGVAALKQEDLNNPYTDRSDNICYWSGWNDCIDDLLKRNFLAGAPVGGDRPAIPGLQEAIERREKLLATKRTLGHENRGIHTEGDPIFEAAKLYASCQSGVPDGYVCVPREPTEAMLDAIADQPYGANAAYEKLIAAAEGNK